MSARLVSDLLTRIRQVVRFGKSVAPAPVASTFPVHQFTYDGKQCNAVVLFPYGMHGVLPPDVLTALLTVGGDASNRVAIGGTTVERPDLLPGEFCLYLPGTDAILKFGTGGVITITSSVPVVIDADVVVTGSLTTTGDITTASVTATGAVVGATVETAAGVGLGTHGHPYTPGTEPPSTTGPGVG